MSLRTCGAVPPARDANSREKMLWRLSSSRPARSRRYRLRRSMVFSDTKFQISRLGAILLLVCGLITKSNRRYVRILYGARTPIGSRRIPHGPKYAGLAVNFFTVTWYTAHLQKSNRLKSLRVFRRRIDYLSVNCSRAIWRCKMQHYFDIMTVPWDTGKVI